jgi:CHAT domain-containing protein/uncharacterized protein HemY
MVSQFRLKLLLIRVALTIPLMLPAIVSAAPAFAQPTTDRRAEATRFWNLCRQQWQERQYDPAIQSCQQAVTLYREVGDRTSEGLVLGGMGFIYGSKGDYARAADYQNQSFTVQQAINNVQGMMMALFNLGQAYAVQGKFPEAIAAFQKGLPLAQTLKDGRSEIQFVGNLGMVYGAQGDYAQAIAAYQRGLELAKRAGDPQAEFSALNGLASTHASQGDYATAISYHRQSLELARKAAKSSDEIRALSSLGLMYYNLGDYEKAIEFQQQGLILARKINDQRGEAAALGLLGLSYSARRDFARGVEYQEQSLVLMRKLGDRQGEQATLSNLGGVYRNLGDYAKSIQAYEQSLALLQPAELQRRATVLANLGSLYRNQSNHAQAAQYYEQSLAIARQVKDLNTEGYSLFNLGLVLFRAGELSRSEHYLRQAMAARESLRSRLGSDDALKVSLGDMEISASTYLYLQQVLIARKQPQAALEIAERGRARAFVELLLRGQQATSTSQSLLPTPQSPTIQQIQQIARQQNATLVQYTILNTAIDLRNQGSFASAKVFIWVVQPNGTISLRQVELEPLLAQQTLEQLVLDGRNLLLRRSRRLGTTATPQLSTRAASSQGNRPALPPLRQLHQVLVQPIADLLPTDPDARIVFIPQGPLFLVPFAALQDASGSYLIERHTISIAPSIQVLDLTRQPRRQLPTHPSPSPSTALVVGNPTMPSISLQPDQPPEQLASLPGAEQEARAIADLLKTGALIGDAATEHTVVQRMAQARLIHLATHGLLEDPTNSGIPGAIALAPAPASKGEQLGDNGFLTASEILQLKLQADLVVLSACDTGRGRITGDGVIGLSRSLIAAGAASVVVSLWAVPDAPTATLMTEFYQNLQKSGDRAGALRQAMLTTLQQYPSPRDWAAFILIGAS